MSENHDDIAAMAKESFSGHRMKKGPGLSWRMWNPKKGSSYSFRVTWTPGHLIVTGDIGSADYCVCPSFGTLWGAIELAHRAGYDYLTGKTGIRQVYDEQGTIQGILRMADERMKYDDFSLWEAIIKKFVWNWGYRGYEVNSSHMKDDWAVNPRSGAIQMQSAKAMRDEGLPEHVAYEVAETASHIYPPETRWCYEALQLWCRTMIATEPTWHRTWRWSQKSWERIKRLPEDWRNLHRRPKLYEHDLNGPCRHFKGHVYAQVSCRRKDGTTYSWMAEVVPFVLRGRIVPGWWKQTGSGGGGMNEFVEISEETAIERVRPRSHYYTGLKQAMLSKHSGPETA